jgi:carbon storage regulator CsrA
MLVLTRKIDEEILIGGVIRLKVIAVRGNRVRLGLQAPREIEISRAEIDALGTEPILVHDTLESTAGDMDLAETLELV